MPGYDSVAEWYDAQVCDEALLHALALPTQLELVNVVAGQRICDLGCGQGVTTRVLARHGARVIGVDISLRMLAIAERYEADDPLGISYVCDDAQELLSFDNGVFHGVSCNLALMDIPNLKATFQAVHRILDAKGWFVAIVTHPCFETPASYWLDEPSTVPKRVMSAYFHEGFWRSADPSGVRGRVGSHHRTLATYMNLLIETGFTIERLVEPAASGRLAERLPGLREMPALLGFRCQRL